MPCSTDCAPSVAEARAKLTSTKVTVRRSFISAMFSHSNLAAILQNRTYRAFRQPSGANVLPERHEQPIDLYTILAGKFLLELATRSFGRRCSHVAPSIRNTMHMYINTDLAGTTRNPQGEVRALRTHPAKRRHHIEVTGHLTAVLFHSALGQIPNVVSFGLVEARWPDESSDFRDVHPADCLCGRSRLEQADCRREGNFVPRAHGYDAGNQLVKRGGITLGSEIEHRGVGKLFDFHPDATQHGVDVERALCNTEHIE